MNNFINETTDSLFFRFFQLCLKKVFCNLRLQSGPVSQFSQIILKIIYDVTPGFCYADENDEVMVVWWLEVETGYLWAVLSDVAALMGLSGHSELSSINTF